MTAAAERARLEAEGEAGGGGLDEAEQRRLSDAGRDLLLTAMSGRGGMLA